MLKHRRGAHFFFLEELFMKSGEVCKSRNLREWRNRDIPTRVEQGRKEEGKRAHQRHLVGKTSFSVSEVAVGKQLSMKPT